MGIGKKKNVNNDDIVHSYPQSVKEFLKWVFRVVKKNNNKDGNSTATAAAAPRDNDDISLNDVDRNDDDLFFFRKRRRRTSTRLFSSGNRGSLRLVNGNYVKSRW